MKCNSVEDQYKVLRSKEHVINPGNEIELLAFKLFLTIAMTTEAICDK